MSYPSGENISTELVAASSSQFDIRKFVYKLVGFLPWILLSVIICYSIAKLYLRYTPQLHRVAAYLLIKDNDEYSSDYEVLKELGVMPGNKEVQNQIDILESYQLAESVVDSLNLQLKFYLEGRIATSTLYGKNMPVAVNAIKNDTGIFKPALYKLFITEGNFTLQKGAEKQTHNYNDTFDLNGRKVFFSRNALVKPETGGYNLQIQERTSVAKSVKSAVTVVKMHDMGGIIEIAMLDQIPERAGDIINMLVIAYNTAGITDKNLVGNKANRFLAERVDTVALELDNLELKAEAFKRVNKINDISSLGNQYLTQTLNFDNLETDQNGQLQLLQSLEDVIAQSKNFSDIIPSNNGIDNVTLITLIQQHNSLVLEYQADLKVSTPKDPTLARLKNQITDIKSDIIKNIESIREGFRTRLSQITLKRSGYESLLASLPEKEREFLKLKRQIGVKEQLYLYLLQKKEETELSLVATINNTRVVDSAYDVGVVAPKSSQIIMFAIVIGIIIPVIIMLLIDFFDNKIADKKEIEEGTSVPIIGELSFGKGIKNTVAITKTRSAIAEQFRLVCANLQYLATGNSSKTVLVTSFMSSEGKSFTSVNLAGSLASMNANVLLLEFDLRKPKLSRYLELKPKYGITDYLVNEIPFSQLISTVPGKEHLDVITCGPVPPNPAELIQTERLEKLLHYARQHYKYIIIDSPPAGLVADSFLLGKYADITLFILRHRYSFKTTIKYIEKLYTEQKLNRLNIVVNGIKEPSGSAYTYGYGYGYSYGYNYAEGYYTDERRKSILGRLFSFFRSK